ncbi:hypothetical protein AMECASPLE_036722 [Ameca splendens]|uniref:Ig-like domain-containing protein n=1 Tax=Ameca splendens TaxID=208324 RepID=A0ABV1AE51_9TELE
MQKLPSGILTAVKPSVPKCWLEGGELIGEAVSLRCHSSKGSSPLKYKWRRESKDPMPAAATQDSATGELRISNHTQSFAGIYLCEVNNAVGAERCRISLRANKYCVVLESRSPDPWSEPLTLTSCRVFGSLTQSSEFWLRAVNDSFSFQAQASVPDQRFRPCGSGKLPRGFRIITRTL